MKNEWREPAFARAFPPGSQRVCEANESGSYEGWGAAIALHEGKFLAANYSHCSCYGPEDNMTRIGEYSCLIDALRGLGEADWKIVADQLDKEVRLG